LFSPTKKWLGLSIKGLLQDKKIERNFLNSTKLDKNFNEGEQKFLKNKANYA
jgi:hypothetical protein